MTNAEKYLKDGVKPEDFAIWLSNALFERGIAVDVQPKAIVDCLDNTSKPQLTEDERVILRNIHEEYKHIRRNEMGNLYVGVDYFGMYDNLFQFIKNGEEYSIEELLK